MDIIDYILGLHTSDEKFYGLYQILMDISKHFLK